MKKMFLFLALTNLLVGCDPYQFDESIFIELKKEPCFGVCPVYSFRVDGKGNAVFEGTRNVSKTGKWSRKLSAEETNAVFKAFQASDFAQFQDEYTAQVTDLPTTWVTFSDGTTKKSIKDYFGAPEALKNLEKMVETIAEQDDGWVKDSGSAQEAQ